MFKENRTLAATLTVYPDAGSGNTTVDGSVKRSSVDETFATIIAAAGTSADDTSAIQSGLVLQGSTTSNQFAQLVRSIYTFDTSPIGESSTISSLTFSIYGSGQNNGLGSPDFDVVSSTPASDNALIAADYSQLGSTAFGSVAYGSFNTSGYNDIVLDSNGISNINRTGISRFGAKLSWDTDGSFGGSWVSGAYTYFNYRFADRTGTSEDPKLTIEYSEGSSSSFFQLF